MNKNAIQKFAIWARNELIAQVSQRAYQYGIEESGFGSASADTIGGRLLTAEEKSQRQELIRKITEKGYKQVMEEVAYTWFNRFIALRFMEVNNYLPSHIRVFSDSTGAFKPEILNDVLHLNLPGLDSGKVAEYIESNDTDNLYRYLLLTQCNALNEALPVMFERMGGYTELLLPNNILKQDGVLGRMISDIPEEDWQDAVQIIGWLYQYYNSELKDDTFAQLKKNVKITKERIPAATQLFTPDWIVRYMVENSLGRLWLEGHPNAELHDGWKYYLDEAQQEPEVEAQLAKIREEYKSIKPEDIKVIDPCMGSGHILVYAFDVLMQIYTAAGWDQREAAQSILKNNLYGLDIDDRAAQLAYFAVMMKARQYDRRLFSRGIQPNVMAIQESNTLEAFDHLQGQLSLNNVCLETANQLIRTFRNAKEYGSILDVDIAYLNTADRLMEQLYAINGDFELMAWIEKAENLLPVLAKQAGIMQQKYDVVVTNPPYMGSSGMSTKLSDFVKAKYPDSKSDLFAVFIERCGQMAKENGYQAMITQHAWMFLSSFEKLRAKLLSVDIVNMAHLGARAFEEIGGEVVQTTTFVIRKSHVADYKGEYCRLIEPTTQQGKEDMFLAGENRYEADQSNFSKIPGSPVAYWASAKVVQIFSTTPRLIQVFETRNGMSTTNNDLFLKLWHEVSVKKIGNSDYDAKSAAASGKKWFPYNKGGEYRRWYGNRSYLVNWENDGEYLKNYVSRRYGSYSKEIRSENRYFFESVTWSGVGASKSGFRFSPKGVIFDSGANGLFTPSHRELLYVLGLLNSSLVDSLLQLINPTINTGSGTVGNFPTILNESSEVDVIERVKSSVAASKSDWDSYETSWDFKRNPLV